MDWTEILKFSLPLLFSGGIFFVGFLALLLAGISAMLSPIRKDIIRLDGELKEIKANQVRFDEELREIKANQVRFDGELQEIKALLNQLIAEGRK